MYMKPAKQSDGFESCVSVVSVVSISSFLHQYNKVIWHSDMLHHFKMFSSFVYFCLNSYFESGGWVIKRSASELNLRSWTRISVSRLVIFWNLGCLGRPSLPNFNGYLTYAINKQCLYHWVNSYIKTNICSVQTKNSFQNFVRLLRYHVVTKRGKYSKVCTVLDTSCTHTAVPCSF